jgi:hypothetical protein
MGFAALDPSDELPACKVWLRLFPVFVLLRPVI